MKSEAITVAAYLRELPSDRRKEIKVLRRLIKDNLPKGYVEQMDFGMITYCIPLSVYPNTYNQKPLMYAALAVQKNYNAVYLMSVYGDPQNEAKLREGFKQIHQKTNMGKSCIRFKSATDLPLTTIGELIAGTSVSDYIKKYENSRKK